jgi:aerobic carbon-monoxide dehydrogenase medium subunit
VQAFAYRKPSSLAEAGELLRGDDEAKLLAGGMTLLPTMKMRLAQPSVLIDLHAIAELRGIRQNGTSIEIGAMTTHAEVSEHALLQQAIPALANLARGIGDAQVRNRGTLGGSVANSDPAADYPAAVLGLGATVVTDRREIAADEFFIDMFETALAADEIIVAVRFPQPAGAAYLKFPNPASRYAVVGVMVARFAGQIRVAVTGAGACAFRQAAFEEALAKRFTPDALDGLAIDSATFNNDMHASQDYRAHLLTILAKRAVLAASA